MVRVRRAAKKGGGCEKKMGCKKKGGAPHHPFFKKWGARSTGTPLNTPLISIAFNDFFYIDIHLTIISYILYHKDGHFFSIECSH